MYRLLHDIEYCSLCYIVNLCYAFISFLKIFLKFILFFAVLGLLCCGAFSGYGVQASHCGGVSPFGARALGWVGFSNCGVWTQ